MEKIRLGDICELLNGYAFKSNLYCDNGIRIIRITNVQKGYREDKEPKYYSIEKKNEINKYLLKEYDLLISLTGNVGRVGLIQKELLPAALNQRVACIRLKDNTNILKKYIFYSLNNKLFERKCVDNSKGIAQMNLSTEWLKEYKIALPDIEMQLSISNEIDKIIKIIEIRKKQIEELNQLVKSQFVEMFGDIFYDENKYDTVKLEDIANVGSSHRVFTTEFVEKGVPFYRGTEIGQLANEIVPEETYFIT